ncbi:MAG: hypothetical protein AAGC44_04495 [Planctomycetota bacterium]
MIQRLPNLLAVLLLVSTSTGCGGLRNFDRNNNASPITEADIGYVELASRYNQTVRYFDQLWVRNDIKVDWNETLENGRRRSRNLVGDGKFIFVPPRDSAMTVEHLGTVYLWAGSNDAQYWLFDLTEDDKAVYQGTYEALDRPGTRAMPIPVRPDSVAYLLGVLPLPVNPDAQDQPIVEEFEDQYFIEPPGLNLRMLIDKQTFRPTRVYLTDRQGHARLVSYLYDQYPVKVEGLSGQERPIICKRAEIDVPGLETRITMTVINATTDSSKINDKLFEFEVLQNLHRPSVFINLDGAE